jgi:hypothetical protein
MQGSDLLVLHATPHPVAEVQRAGFPLDHPYLEQCLMSVVGARAVAFLRRMPLLWQVAEPARVPAGELASSVGIEARPGIARTVRRLVQFGLARQLTDLDVAVFAQVPPLPERFLRRRPGWVVEAHGRLLADHRRLLATAGASPAADVAQARSRLDRRQVQAPGDQSAAQPRLGR